MAGGYLSGRVAHIDQLLSQMAMNYRPTGFIADKVFPMVPVQHQSDLYLVYNQGDMFRIEDTKRSRGVEAQKVAYSTSSAGYYAENYALKADVTLEDRLNADPAFVSLFEQGRTQFIMDKLLLDWEARVAALAFATTSVASSAAVASLWTDPVNSNPLIDLQTAIDNVENVTGYRPNRLLFGGDVWRHVRRNNNIKNGIGALGPNITGGGKLPALSEVANLLEVDEILVGRAYYNSAKEGKPTAITRIWTDSVLAYYAPSSPSRETPSFGYSFRWSAPGLPNMGVERHPFDQKTKVDEVEIGYYQDEVITSTALGFLLTGAV